MRLQGVLVMVMVLLTRALESSATSSDPSARFDALLEEARRAVEPESTIRLDDFIIEIPSTGQCFNVNETKLCNQ